MSDVLVRPLVVVREHAGGIVSAHPAAAPGLVCYGSDGDAVLDELRLFLSSYLPRAGADVIQRLVLPEEPVLDEVKVAVPYGPARSRRIRTPVGFPAMLVPARRDARWVLIPSLDHVCFVAGDRLEEWQALVARELERRLHASDLDGGVSLSLLPPLSVRAVRLEVELETPPEIAGRASATRLAERKRKDAREVLERVGRLLVPGGRPAMHRGEETAALRALLESRERISVVLVGPAGAGKSALVQAAIGSRESPLARPVYATSGAELVAGQSFVGQLEEQVEAVMKAADLLDAVLYFESFDDLFADHQGGNQDLASAMRRFVVEGKVRLLGELTAERHDRLQHQHVGFFSYLQQVGVPPLGREQSLDVLRGRRMSPAAAAALLELTERYYPDGALPGVATRFADELESVHGQEVRHDRLIEVDDVFRATSARTGVPEFLLRDERSLLLNDVVRFFHSHLIGQHEAIEQVAEVLCRVKAGVAPRNRPLATFLFVGPTGVGKTELAKVLARFLFGSEDRLARFDMSEYRGPLAAERLIRGTSCEDGVLTRRIREQPFTVLLLDEIEKADSGVFDLLLQVCGEGRLSDAQGKLAHFNNAIIIMTSNLGSQHQAAPAGFGNVAALGREHYVREVREHFRPEFVNRLDRIVAFESLGRDQMREVTEISIARIRRREGLDERGVQLDVSSGAARKLAEDGYSAAYGARGLRRHLEHALVAPMSTVLAGLGRRAAGALLSIRLPGERESAEGEPIGAVEAGGLVVTAFGRPDPRHRNVSGAVEISALRREVAAWDRLSPVVEARERVAELTAELTAVQPRRGAPRIPGAVLGELTKELGNLTELLRPLDDARRELEAIEGMVVAALAEGGTPELFADDAKQAHLRYGAHLVPALLARNTEREVTLVCHELDEHRVLHRWLLPMLEYTRKKGWQAMLHVDREVGGPRERRWGPPRTREEYLEAFGTSTERLFGNVLVRVRGHGAGPLLFFSLGRWIYPQPKGQGEVWVRFGAARFELTPEELQKPSLSPVIDRNVGRKQLKRFDHRTEAEMDQGDQWFEEVTEENFYDHYESMILPELVGVAARGASYLPEVP